MIFERGYFKSTKIEKGHKNELLAESRRFSSSLRPTKPTIFLSHKHNDLEDEKEVAGIIELLESLGAIVYIDTMDYKMPGTTSGDTATRIKKIIKGSDKFLFMATKKAIESFWCNWELGIGDTFKYIDNIAIVPIKEKGQLDTQYTGNEYLQIYPHLDRVKTPYRNFEGDFFETGYYINQPENKQGRILVTKLEAWLKKK